MYQCFCIQCQSSVLHNFFCTCFLQVNSDPITADIQYEEPGILGLSHATRFLKLNNYYTKHIGHCYQIGYSKQKENTTVNEIEVEKWILIEANSED